MSSDASDDGGSSVISDSLANNSSSDDENNDNNSSSLTSNEKSEYLRLDWLRKLSLLKKYCLVDDEFVQQCILHNTETEEDGILYDEKEQKYIRTKEEEDGLSVDDNIEPTSKDLVWVLGK